MFIFLMYMFDDVYLFIFLVEGEGEYVVISRFLDFVNYRLFIENFLGFFFYSF